MCVCLVYYSVIYHYHIHRHRDRVRRRPNAYTNKMKNSKCQADKSITTVVGKTLAQAFLRYGSAEHFPHHPYLPDTNTLITDYIAVRLVQQHIELLQFGHKKRDHHQFTQSIIKQRLMSVLHAVRPCANVWLEWFNMLSQRSINEAKAHLIRCISHGHNERQWAPNDSHFTVHQTWLEIS